MATQVHRGLKSEVLISLADNHRLLPQSLAPDGLKYLEVAHGTTTAGYLTQW